MHLPARTGCFRPRCLYPSAAAKPCLGAQDPLAKLEHVTDDKRRAKQTRSRITELVMDAEIKFGDDYAINKLLRAKNRCGHAVKSQHCVEG